MLEFFVNNNKTMMIVTPLLIVLYEWWYPQSRTVLLALVGMSFIYSLFLKREHKSFVFVLINLMALFGFEFYINAVIVTGFYIFYNKKPEIFDNWKNVIILFVLVGLGLVFSGTLNLLIGKFLAYFSRGNVAANELHFYSVMKTIREASQIPYNVVANRISGGMVFFIVSFIGYILMLIRYPVFAITLPMVAIGIMAHKLGLRLLFMRFLFLLSDLLILH